MMDRAEVLRKLGNYSYNKYRLTEIQEQIASICIKTTPTYGNLTGGSSGGGFSSKVEKAGNRSYELCKIETMLLRKVEEVERLIDHSGLTDREKNLMWWIANNGKLQAYARREKIGRDNVYKIRDRAINKIILANTPHNVA